MTYLSPYERRDRRRKRLRAFSLFLLALLILIALDPFIAQAVHIENQQWVKSKDLYYTLRILGSAWIWIAVTLAFYLHDRVWDRAGSVFLGTLLAGLVAEFFKRAIPRSRPYNGEFIVPGWSHWRPLFSGFENHRNLGMPSSHTAVAFAGCLVMAVFFPRARWVFWSLAIACGLSRMITGAHFASDVLVGGAIGWWWARFFEPPAPDRARLA